jgi:hypothetical protein
VAHFEAISLILPPARLPPLRHVSYHFPPPHPRLRFLKRPVFWVLPIAGGISLYFYPRPQPVLSQLVSSPTLIPCPPRIPDLRRDLDPISLRAYLSPSQRICALFVEHIWEPILTARRFVHLFFLFIPRHPLVSHAASWDLRRRDYKVISGAQFGGTTIS